MTMVIKAALAITLAIHVALTEAKDLRQADSDYASNLTDSLTMFMAQSAPEWDMGGVVPGILEAMRGYHIFEGDPVNELTDPGFRQPILEPTKTLADGTEELYPAFTTHKTTICDGTTSVDAVSKMYDYYKATGSSMAIDKSLQLGTKTEFSLSLSEGGGSVGVKTTLPPPFSARSSSGSEASNIEKLFTDERGVVSMARATCVLYEVQMDDYFQTAPFSSSFKNGVKMLYDGSPPSGAAPANGAEMLKRMFDHFGTHYTTDTWLGAKMIVQRRYSAQQRTMLNNDLAKKCTMESDSFSFLGVISTSEQKKECKTKLEKQTHFKSQYVSDWKMRTYGSHLAKDIIEWQKGIDENPAVVKMKLKPWVLLLDKVDNLQQIDPGMNDPKRLAWVKPMFDNYCQVFHVDCKTVEKCGVNDKCKIDEECDMIGGKAVCKPVDKVTPANKCAEKVLGQPGATVFSRNAKGDTALMRAVCNRDADCVQSILAHPQSGDFVNAHNNVTYTALHWAAAFDAQMVQLLLRHPDIDVYRTADMSTDIARATGFTPLHRAIDYGTVDCIKELLAHKQSIPDKVNMPFTITIGGIGTWKISAWDLAFIVANEQLKGMLSDAGGHCKLTCDGESHGISIHKDLPPVCQNQS